MTGLRSLASIIKASVRSFSPRWRLSRSLRNCLPPVVCVDVGASYFPHARWEIFLASPSTRWIAVEPNEKNLGYVETWRWPSQVEVRATGLSREGGSKTLYVTNIDSGSSLLEPVISEAMEHRIADLSYFFPLEKRQIDTASLQEVVEPDDRPTFIKLDTQGTELSILQGAYSLFESGRIVGIEMESTLQAQPVMSGAGKFWQACQFLENMGFELLILEPIPSLPVTGSPGRDRKTYLNECDAVFAIRADIAVQRAVEYRVALMAFYATNTLYEEALSLVSRDVHVASYLRERGCNLESLTAQLRKLAG